MIGLTINGRDVQVKEGSTILEAAAEAGAKIPTLCHIKGMSPTGACRLCVVEVEGKPGLIPSCAYPAEAGMKVSTHSTRVLAARKTIVELLLASHPFDCPTCSRNQRCELQGLAALYKIEQVPYYIRERRHYPDFSSHSIVRNPDKCILCGRCVRVCEEVQGISAIDFTRRGFTGFKEAVVEIGELELKVAVVNTTAQAGALLDRIKRGEAEYDFVEVMACPGGCSKPRQ